MTHDPGRSIWKLSLPGLYIIGCSWHFNRMPLIRDAADIPRRYLMFTLNNNL